MKSWIPLMPKTFESNTEIQLYLASIVSRRYVYVYVFSTHKTHPVRSNSNRSFVLHNNRIKMLLFSNRITTCDRCGTGCCTTNKKTTLPSRLHHRYSHCTLGENEQINCWEHLERFNSSLRHFKVLWNFCKTNFVVRIVFDCSGS